MGLKRKIEDISNFLTDKKFLNKNIGDFGKLPHQIFNESEPVFVLSTGRCGTKLLTKLFEIACEEDIHHEPDPQMIFASRFVHENRDKGIDVRKSAFLGGRYELLKGAYLKGYRYIETNNQITFFADAILDLIPQTKFIHLIRHPGDFVRSGIRRKYYECHDYDDGRIQSDDSALWKSYSQLQKIGWLWNETNTIVEVWKKTIFGKNVLTVNSEDLFSDAAIFQSICDFLELPIPENNKVKKIIDRPVNVQTKGNFPHFEQWSDEDKIALKKIAPLGYTYGFFSD